MDQCFQDEHREFQYFVIDYLKIKNKFIVFEDIEKIKNIFKRKSGGIQLMILMQLLEIY